MANLMERGGTGFQTMIESYSNSAEHLQPVVLIYPGFLDLRLFDRFYEDNNDYIIQEELSATERVLELLRTEGPKQMKELQEVTNYKSRSQFLKDIINPLMEDGVIYRDGNSKSPKALIKLNK